MQGKVRPIKKQPIDGRALMKHQRESMRLLRGTDLKARPHHPICGEWGHDWEPMGGDTKKCMRCTRSRSYMPNPNRQVL